MEATLAWALRPLPPTPHRGAAGTDRAGQVVLVVVSVPDGATTERRVTPAAANATLRAESPAIVGSVTTPEGRTIYVRGSARDAPPGAPDASSRLPGGPRGEALLDLQA